MTGGGCGGGARWEAGSVLTDSMMTESGVLPVNTKPRFRAALTNAPSSVRKQKETMEQLPTHHETVYSLKHSNVSMSDLTS